MASKIKGLQYEANEPAFLQRIRAKNGGGDGRHERPIPRPRRNKAEDEDDAPTYVMEDSNDTLSKQEYERILNSKLAAENGDEGGENVRGELTGDGPYMSGALPPSDVEHKSADNAERSSSTKLNEAKLGHKKRKVAAVVGQDEQDSGNEAVEKKSRKVKKKGGAVKLSFDTE
ncbi:hypothetical protein ANO11243_070780 [Dothideomycetidae sp. 11243]|nr:hypothetical protein ANO11243_070780 [fungal sp. No.11243]